MSDETVRIDDGGPAFPQIKSAITAFDENGVPLGSGITGFDRGMCLRDWFAGQAMQAIIAHSELVEDGKFLYGPQPGTSAIDNFAAFSYVMADAMLAARKAGGK